MSMKIHWAVNAAVRILAISILPCLAIPFINARADNTPCELQDKECFAEDEYPACREKRVIQKYYEFMDDGREALARGLLAEGSGCIRLSGNEKVYMMDKSAGYVKFSFRGREGVYWAKREAICAK